MALIFPSNPTLNQVFSTGSLSWTWNGKSWNNGTSILVTSNLVSSSVQFTNGNTNAFDTTSNITVGQITASFAKISGSIFGTASFAILAQTASYVENAQTASYVTLAQTASYVTLSQTASYVTLSQTASYVTLSQTASYISTASYALAALSASYAPNIYVLPNNVVSASAQLSNNGGVAFDTNSNITVNQITASFAKITNLTVEYVTSSVMVITGSNKFGDASNDKQEFTGSVSISGSLSIVGNVTSNNVLSLASGTVALPSLILSTDTTSGMYRIGANNIGISISAAKVLDISSTGLSVTGALSASGGYNGTVGATTPSTGAFTTLSASGFSQISNLSVQSAPNSAWSNFRTSDSSPIADFYNSSNVVVAKITSTGLNSTPIGATSPSTGAFTTLSATGDVTLAATSNLIANKSVLLSDGTAGTATGAIYFINDTDTGIYRAGANSIGFMGNGASIGVWSTTGLSVTGAFSATGSATITGGAAIGQPAFQATGNQAGQLIANLTSSITTAGSSFGLRVAAGTNASDYAFRVLNQAGTLDYLFVKGDGAVSMSNGLDVTGALSCTGNANFGTTASSARITLGHATNSTVDNSIILRTGSTKTAWLLGAQFTTDNGFEIIPSTTVGGTTFTTPVFQVTATGVAVTGALSATTAGRFGTTSATIHGTESLSALASSGVTVGFTCDAAASWPLSLWHKGTGTKDLAAFYSNDGGSFGLRGKIQTDGTGVSLISSSDERLKTNFRPITNSGAIIDALAPSLFDWLSGQKDTYGFGAQSTYQVFPQAVAKGDDNLTEITDQWGMDVSKLVPILVAELKALRQRVAALEAK